MIPIILGADKTTVSVATGHVEYHPLYLTIGNISNALRRAHCNAVVPIGFLAIPKCTIFFYLSHPFSYLFSAERKYDKDVNFRVFKKQLYHKSIAAILKTLKPGMSIPVVHRCPDGHYRRCIYDLAAFIADYPEQVVLTGIVQGWCGRLVNLFHFTPYILLNVVSKGVPLLHPISMPLLTGVLVI